MWLNSLSEPEHYSEAFKIDLHDESSKIAYGVNGASFLEIVNAGINMLGLSVQNGEEKIEEDPVILKSVL